MLGAQQHLSIGRFTHAAVQYMYAIWMLDNAGIIWKTGHLTSLFGGAMHLWPVQDAKARFSEFLDACLSEGPQMVTRRGAEAAVLVPVQEWRRLQACARPSLKQLLLADIGRGDLVLPSRGKAKRRNVEPLL